MLLCYYPSRERHRPECLRHPCRLAVHALTRLGQGDLIIADHDGGRGGERGRVGLREKWLYFSYTPDGASAPLFPHRPLLVCTDGLGTYIRAICATFRDPVPTGKGGRPRLRPWRNVLIAQAVKRYERRRTQSTVLWMVPRHASRRSGAARKVPG